jgi:hypothetical protein
VRRRSHRCEDKRLHLAWHFEMMMKSVMTDDMEDGGLRRCCQGTGIELHLPDRPRDFQGFLAASSGRR